MAQDTTVFQNEIATEYFVSMISKYQGKKCLDAIFMDGAVGDDNQGLLSDAENVLKAPTAVSFDGKAKTIVVPIMPRAVGSVTALAQVNDAVEVTYTPEICTLTLNEYGRQKATITGLAQLQVYDGAVAQVLAYMVECAADTKERLIGSIICAGGTKAASEAADAVKYFQTGPVAQGGGVFKPSRILTPEDIDMALVSIKANATPFDNGLYMGVIHVEQEPGLKSLAGNQLESFQNYSAASPFPSNIRAGVIGAWKGVMWFSVDNPYFKTASGSHDGSPSYKTAIFGKNFIAKGFVNVASLPLSAKADVVQIPFDDFVIRVAPDYTDPHNRNCVVTYWLVAAYGVADRDAGCYIRSMSNYSGSEAASMA